MLLTGNAEDEVVSAASEFLESDPTKRQQSVTVEPWLNLPDVSARRLDEANDVLSKLEDAQRDLDNVQRSLAAAPKEDAIKGVATELKAATAEMTELQQRHNRVERELTAAVFETSK